MTGPPKPVLLRRASSFHHEEASMAFSGASTTSSSTIEDSWSADLAATGFINHNDIAYVAWPDDCTYTGEVDDDVAHGLGVKRSKKGWLYCGQWCYGKEHGLGVYVWSDGSWYAGEWQCGKADGIGVWCSRQGNTYAGEWSGGQKNQLGKQSWCDDNGVVNREYIGMWRLGTRVGLGVQIGQGEQYAGQFAGNRRHGLGTLEVAQRDPRGWTYAGSWNEGIRHGFGREVCGRAVYTGQFALGHRHGYGAARKDGRSQRGRWKKGLTCKQTLPTVKRKVKAVISKACDTIDAAMHKSTAAWTTHARGVECAATAMHSAIKARAVVCATMSLLESCRGSTQHETDMLNMNDFPSSFHDTCQRHFNASQQALVQNGHAPPSSPPPVHMTAAELRLEDAAAATRLPSVVSAAAPMPSHSAGATTPVQAPGKTAINNGPRFSATQDTSAPLDRPPIGDRPPARFGSTRSATTQSSSSSFALHVPTLRDRGRATSSASTRTRMSGGVTAAASSVGGGRPPRLVGAGHLAIAHRATSAPEPFAPQNKRAGGVWRLLPLLLLLLLALALISAAVTAMDGGPFSSLHR